MIVSCPPPPPPTIFFLPSFLVPILFSSYCKKFSCNSGFMCFRSFLDTLIAPFSLPVKYLSCSLHVFYEFVRIYWYLESTLLTLKLENGDSVTIRGLETI